MGAQSFKCFFKMEVSIPNFAFFGQKCFCQEDFLTMFLQFSNSPKFGGWQLFFLLPLRSFAPLATTHWVWHKSNNVCGDCLQATNAIISSNITLWRCFCNRRTTDACEPTDHCISVSSGISHFFTQFFLSITGSCLADRISLCLARGLSTCNCSNCLLVCGWVLSERVVISKWPYPRYQTEVMFYCSINCSHCALSDCCAWLVYLSCCVFQPSYKASSTGRQEDMPLARESSHSSRSQFSAELPSPLSSAVPAHSGEPVASTSVSQCRPASTAAQSQRTPFVVSSEPQQPASRASPPSSKQRLICSVDVPGIGQAARVSCVNIITYCNQLNCTININWMLWFGFYHDFTLVSTLTKSGNVNARLTVAITQDYWNGVVEYWHLDHNNWCCWHWWNC